MKWRPIAGIVLRQYYLLRGSPVRLFPVTMWGAIDIILWGFITRYLNSINLSKITFVPTLLGAVLLWDISSRIMTGVSTAFLEDVWSRNLLNVFGSPISIAEYILGLILTSLVTACLGLIVMLILSRSIFGLHLLAIGPALTACLLILFLFGLILGILASALVLRFGPASEWLIWPVPALLSPFAGVFYPLTVLPVWMQRIAALIPPSYVFEGMRGVLAGNSPPIQLLAKGAIIAAVELTLTIILYAKVYKLAARTGLLARYSAESPG